MRNELREGKTLRKSERTPDPDCRQQRPVLERRKSRLRMYNHLKKNPGTGEVLASPWKDSR
ncbi:hypothetical protein CEE34_03595 [Candidatus Aerophobetes bacterium Ae_b3a]|nr:MAG: hypothetical protein CEE34_03595 [Candidatus Aerophobetes bacterium Ae_b3a]